MDLDTAGPPGVDAAGGSRGSGLLSRITRLEILAGGLAAAVLVVLVLLEPDIVEAPFASGRAVVATVGGTLLAAVAFVVMLALRVPAIIRVLVLGIPLVLVSWWLLEPYFVDDVVDDVFATSIADAEPPSGTVADEAAPSVPPELPGGSTSTVAPPTTAAPVPVLVSAGSFVGLAGHEGRGDAGIFRLPEGGHVLRFENFDIENGPDLRVYLVPGLDRTDLADGSIDLGRLRGNVGDQTYELPEAFDAAGEWTALVWCEAFAVEFVGATLLQR